MKSIRPLFLYRRQTLESISYKQCSRLDSVLSSMLLEYFALSQELSNVLAMFNRYDCATVSTLSKICANLLEDIFVHSRVENRRSDVNQHIRNLRAVIEFMRTNTRYSNASPFIIKAKEKSLSTRFI